MVGVLARGLLQVGCCKWGCRRLLIGALSVCSLCKRACAVCGSTDARRAVW